MQDTKNNNSLQKIIPSENIVSIFSKTYIVHIGWACTVLYTLYSLITSSNYIFILILFLFSVFTTIINIIFKTTTELKQNLNDANLKIVILEDKNFELEKNRDALSRMVEKHRNNASQFENAYITSKIGISGIIRSHRITKDKDAILKIFEDIENNLRKDDSNE